MHVVVLPSWYPKSETDVDGIFFRLQAQALQCKGLKVGVIAPLFRSLRTEWKSVLTGPYGMRHHRQGGLNTYVYDSMYFFPHCPVVDIDRIRWVRAGMKAFKRYVAENGKPDVLHAHTMNFGGVLAHEISKKYSLCDYRTQQRDCPQPGPSEPMAQYERIRPTLSGAFCGQQGFLCIAAREIRFGLGISAEYFGR